MTTLREAAALALEAYDAHEPLAVVMEALRTALAEPQAKPRSDYRDWDYQDDLDKLEAEPEQEPVALIRLKTESRFIGGSDMGLGCSNGYVTQRYLAIEFVNYNMSNPAKSVFKDGDVLYTHQPQRKPLTDEEILEISRKLDAICAFGETSIAAFDFLVIARAIERAHGIGGEA